MQITQKELKTILSKERAEFQRYIGVITANFTSEIKLIAESLSDMQRQLIALREMIAKNTEDIETIKLDIQFIKQELKQKVNWDEFTALERRVALIETKIRK